MCVLLIGCWLFNYMIVLYMYTVCFSVSVLWEHCWLRMCPECVVCVFMCLYYHLFYSHH